MRVNKRDISLFLSIFIFPMFSFSLLLLLSFFFVSGEFSDFPWVKNNFNIPLLLHLCE